MDEILIEDKKYISSRQAAKITGYAKDYVGQLCREGRVPARLVGRSWYVLEAAIQDHRFGGPVVEQEEVVRTTPAVSTRSTWESPRYEALIEEALPSVNRLRDIEGAAEESSEGMKESLEDSWREWFDRFDTAAIPGDVSEGAMDTEDEKADGESLAIESTDPEPDEGVVVVVSEPGERVEEAEAEVAVAIHTVPQDHSQPREPIATIIPKKQRSWAPVMIRTVGIVSAALMAALAIIGSGYLDDYIGSDKRASIVAGVSFYNR
ncbi:MAG: helix-turn-helix domain-containing protein [Candidatus Paceibacterota bacterium]|jgi:hypothetical protein